MNPAARRIAVTAVAVAVSGATAATAAVVLAGVGDVDGGPGRSAVLARDGISLFSSRFADAALREWPLRQAAAPGRIRVQTGPGASGRAVRFEVRHGDRVGGDLDARAEVGWDRRLGGEGESLAYGWSLWFPQSFPRSRQWQVVTQFKNEGPGPPPLTLDVRDGCLRMSTGLQAGQRVLWQTPLEHGRWLRFVTRVTWSSSPARGSVELSYQGEPVLPARRLATLYPGRGNYFKMGLYRHRSVRQTGVAYGDDVTIRQSRPPQQASRTLRPAGRC